MEGRWLSLSLALCAAATLGAAAQERGTTLPAPSTERTYVTYVKGSVLAERDLPLLSMILQNTPVRDLIAHDPSLKAATVDRWAEIARANHSCDGDTECKARSTLFTPQQISSASEALHRLYGNNVLLRDFVHLELQPPTRFSLDDSQSEESVLIEAWVRSANQMNRIILTYCNGAAPRYPEIDSITYTAKSKPYAGLVTIILGNLSLEDPSLASSARTVADTLFFEPSLRFTVRLLEANSRDEAGRFWPLQSGENAAAVHQIRSITWAEFPYSVIVIPGAGSELANVSISPWGRERVMLGVQAYRAGKAPYILLSGGFVHPTQTPYCEAIEMKRYLMDVYDIPASALLVDPYARHTTTNLRNAAREVFDYGLPSNKPMLIVSDSAQIAYIVSAGFAERNRNELGYLPVTFGKQLSSTEIEAIPSVQALYVNGADPLDP